MNKSLSLAIAAIIMVALAAFFYPKDAGGTCGGWCPSPPSAQRVEYGCLGFKQDIIPTNCLDCGIKVRCYGIVTDDKTCYTYLNGFNNTPTEVACTSGVKGVR